MARSSLYVGSVVHRRLQPKPHRLRHSVFWLLLDLDELDSLETLRLLSRNRFNAISFYDQDHGEQTAEPLRAQVDRHLSGAGIALPGGSIQLLCMPRVLGYGFNPLSIYFCRRSDGRIAALLYEVRNTFGERHTYLIPADSNGGACIYQECDKQFYVSPFMEMALRYAFRVSPPAARFSVAITGGDADGPVIVAAMAGHRVPLSDLSLARVLLTIPFLTLKVIGAIHWHALKMWLKGFTLVRRPPAPRRPVTIVGVDG